MSIAIPPLISLSMDGAQCLIRRDRVSKSHSRTFATNFQQLINYAHSFGNHNMTLLFGHENSTSTDEGVSATRSGMFSYFDNQELSGAIKVQDGSRCRR